GARGRSFGGSLESLTRNLVPPRHPAIARRSDQGMKVGHAAAENGPRATLFALDASCDEPAEQVQHGRMTLDVDAECERDVAAAQLGATAALDIGEYQTPGFACKPRHARIGPQDSDDALNDGGDRGVGVRLVKGR